MKGITFNYNLPSEKSVAVKEKVITTSQGRGRRTQKLFGLCVI